MNWNKVMAWMVAVVLLAGLGGTWAHAGHNLTEQTSHLVGVLTLICLIILFVIGAAAYALFWENVLETRIRQAW